MRHKMARKRFKKKPLTFTKSNLLHSKLSKSTYFYSDGKSSDSKPLRKHFINDFRWSSRHCEQNFNGFRLRDGANPTRSSRETKSYNKMLCGGVSYILPVTCGVALLLVMGLCINPISSSSLENAYAAEGDGGMSVSLSLDNPTETTLAKDAKAGEINYVSSNFEVSAANTDGYNVYVQTAPGSTNKLTNGTLTIDFVKTDTPASGFTDNTWGYSVDDTGVNAASLTYNPIPDAAAYALNPAYSSSQSTETKKLSLNFAVKFASDATPGHYTSGVVLSVAAGAREVAKTWDELVYMQDMNPTACASQPTPAAGVTDVPTKTLIDSRDGSTYTIAKLKDGNCWMTQNLRILSTMLMSEDSDVTENYYLPASVSFDETNDAPKYFSNSDTHQSRVYYSGNTDNYGAYYNWYTATAGTGDASFTSGNASSSICPKGWRLPTGSTSGEFHTLLNGLDTNTIIAAPYNYVYGGDVDSSSLNRVGSSGSYWSSTATGRYNAYKLSFATHVANPFFYYDMPRYDGYSVRCVAR